MTNREKVDYARKQGYETEEYLDAETIRARREKRFEQAESGKIHPNYDWKQIASASLKAGVIGAVIGMTAETVASYQSWKAGEMTSGQYLVEVLKSRRRNRYHGGTYVRGDDPDTGGGYGSGIVGMDHGSGCSSICIWHGDQCCGSALFWAGHIKGF